MSSPPRDSHGVDVRALLGLELAIVRPRAVALFERTRLDAGEEVRPRVTAFKEPLAVLAPQPLVGFESERLDGFRSRRGAQLAIPGSPQYIRRSQHSELDGSDCWTHLELFAWRRMRERQR